MDALKAQQNNVLAALREAADKRRGVEEHVARLVASAREHDVAWTEIGQVLGVSKQAAWERYGRNDPHPQRSLPPE